MNAAVRFVRGCVRFFESAVVFDCRYWPQKAFGGRKECSRFSQNHVCLKNWLLTTSLRGATKNKVINGFLGLRLFIASSSVNRVVMDAFPVFSFVFARIVQSEVVTHLYMSIRKIVTIFWWRRQWCRPDRASLALILRDFRKSFFLWSENPGSYEQVGVGGCVVMRMSILIDDYMISVIVEFYLFSHSHAIRTFFISVEVVTT